MKKTKKILSLVLASVMAISLAACQKENKTTEAPAKNEEEALEIIKQRKKKFADATHNVYAYMIGDGTVSRYSDDGEPQGTSGMPTLNSIRMSGLMAVSDAFISDISAWIASSSD